MMIEADGFLYFLYKLPLHQTERSSNFVFSIPFIIEPTFSIFTTLGSLPLRVFLSLNVSLPLPHQVVDTLFFSPIEGSFRAIMAIYTVFPPD